MIRAGFEQGMESVSSFKKNTVTKKNTGSFMQQQR